MLVSGKFIKQEVMRKTLKFTAVVAFMFVTLISSANEFKSSVVTGGNGKGLTFKLDAIAEETEIKLINEDNVVLYSETISKHVEYLKRFDFQNLEDGVYTMEVEDSLKLITYTISLKDNQTVVLDEKAKSKPVFRTKGEVVYLNLLNLDEKSVTVEVYDNADRIVFSEELGDEMIIEKAFNFTKAFKGQYTVIVKKSENTYYESITID